MVLAFDARPATRDVDAVFVPKREVYEAAAQVADELGLPGAWLNDGVKGFISPAGELTDDGMPQWPNLRILRPSTRYLLAMKCMASRVADYDGGGDRDDIITLCKELGLDSASEVIEVVADYYPENLIPAKTTFFIEEVIEEMKGGMA